MAGIDGEYWKAHTHPSDINEHIETLYTYAKECESVLELGVRGAVSSWAFLKGLVENGRPTKTLVGVDLDYHPTIARVQEAAAARGVDYTFVQGDDLAFDASARFDMTFIDTWHVYGQLKRELQRFAPLTNKYIAMHDTKVDAVHGESLRCGFNVAAQSQRTGIPAAEIARGLQPAIDEFLAAHPREWVIACVRENNNGLTVLKRLEEV